MLPQQHRLRHEKDIKALFAKGKSAFGICLGIKVRPNSLALSRFAVVVGTKVSKNAVDRNKVKRRVRGIIEKQLDKIAPGYDVLVLTKKETLTKTFQELEQQLTSLLKRARLL